MTQPVSSPVTMQTAAITVVDVFAKQIEMQGTLNAIASQLPDHEQRIRKLEAWRYSLPTSLILAILSIVLTILTSGHVVTF